MVSQALDDTGFQLTSPFLGNAIFRAQVVQGQRGLREKTVAQDVFVPLIEGLDELRQLRSKERLQL